MRSGPGRNPISNLLIKSPPLGGHHGAPPRSSGHHHARVVPARTVEPHRPCTELAPVLGFSAALERFVRNAIADAPSGEDPAPVRKARSQHPTYEPPHGRADDGVAEPGAAAACRHACCRIIADIGSKRGDGTEGYRAGNGSRDQTRLPRVVANPQPPDPADPHRVRSVLLASISPEDDQITRAAHKGTDDAGVARVERRGRLCTNEPPWSESGPPTRRRYLLCGGVMAGGEY